MNLPKLFAKKRRYFGLSIDKTALRAIEVNAQHQIVAYAEEPLAAEVLDGGVTSRDKFTQSVQSLLKRARFTTPYVSVCFPESYAFSREHIFPQVEEVDISEAISWQVKDIFPFPPKEIYFDWKMLKSTETEASTLIIAVQKKALDDFTSSFNHAGLCPVSFAPSASVLGPLMPHKEGEIVILVEINRLGSMATIVEHHVSFLTTTALFADNDPGLGITQTVASVQGLIMYYAKKKKLLQQQKAQILLSGEAASNHVLQAIAAKFSYPVQLLTLPNVPPAYHKAYAAAVQDFSRPENIHTINLLPVSFQRVYDLEDQYRQYAASIKTGIALLAVSLIVLLTSFGVLFVQKKQVTTRIEQLESALQKAGFNRELVNTVNTQANTIVTLFPRKKTPEAALSTVYKLVPEGITITSVIFDSNKQNFQIAGQADRRENILLYRDRLKSDAQFETIEVPLSSLEHQENINFSLTVRVARNTQDGK